MRLPKIAFLFVLAAGCAGTQSPAAGTGSTPPPPSAAPAEGANAPTTHEAKPAAQEAATVAIPNAQNPLPGVVTGGQPSEENLREAKTLGYKTVISLLPESDSMAEAKLAHELGLRFISIPISGATDLTKENAQKLADAMDPGDAKPLILHCASGNRAGALLALKAFLVDHTSSDQALLLGQRAGLRSLQPAVEERMRTSNP